MLCSFLLATSYCSCLVVAFVDYILVFIANIALHVALYTKVTVNFVVSITFRFLLSVSNLTYYSNDDQTRQEISSRLYCNPFL